MGIDEEVPQWVEANWDLDMSLREWWQRLSDAGLAFPAWPEQLGGRGWRPSQARDVLVARRQIIMPPGASIAAYRHRKRSRSAAESIRN